MNIIALIIAYLIGSIPFGLILTRAAGLGDVRTIGSGNIGATNVLRTGNKKLAALTLLLDGLKGWVAVTLTIHAAVDSRLFYYDITGLSDLQFQLRGITILSFFAAPIAPVLGHIFPVWLKFKGGKGVATAFGAVLALFPIVGIAGLGFWLAIFLITRISSLSALVSISAMPFITLIGHGVTFFIPQFIIALLVAYRHKDNIRRLLNGTEPKFGKTP